MKSIIAIVFAFALGGCALTTAHYTWLSSPPHTIHPHEAAPLITTGAPRDRRYVEIGVIEVRDANEFSSANTQQLMLAMRNEGGRRGCDSVVLNSPHEEMVGAMVTYHGLRGTCIVFAEADDGR